MWIVLCPHQLLKNKMTPFLKILEGADFTQPPPSPSRQHFCHSGPPLVRIETHFSEQPTKNDLIGLKMYVKSRSKILNLFLKVSKSRKQILASSILPNEQKICIILPNGFNNFLEARAELGKKFRSFFGKN